MFLDFIEPPDGGKKENEAGQAGQQVYHSEHNIVFIPGSWQDLFQHLHRMGKPFTDKGFEISGG